MTSDLCRQCGACLYICPVCELRCQGAQAETTLCNGCLNISTVCFQSYDNAMCFLDPCHACEIGGPFRADMQAKLQAKELIHLGILSSSAVSHNGGHPPFFGSHPSFLTETIEATLRIEGKLKPD